MKITIFDIREVRTVPRAKFQTLTEQMFYILLCLRGECCGADIMAQVQTLTGGRVSVGPGSVSVLDTVSPGVQGSTLRFQPVIS